MPRHELTMNDVYRRSERAAETALARFYSTHPEIDGIALDTIRDFAHERFSKAATLARVLDARFEAEAPLYYYRLLVEESLTLAKAVR